MPKHNKQFNVRFWHKADVRLYGFLASGGRPLYPRKRTLNSGLSLSSDEGEKTWKCGLNAIGGTNLDSKNIPGSCR